MKRLFAKKIQFLLLSSFLTFIPNFVKADIKLDVENNKFYSALEKTDTADTSIDQQEYHILVMQVSFILMQNWNNGVYGAKAIDKIYAYLKSYNSPASLRLLEDLKKQS